MWNQAYPDKKLAGPEPPIAYALGAAKYELPLQEAEQADVRGTCELVLFTAKPVSIPLPLSGGVLVSALVDDKPARVQFVTA